MHKKILTLKDVARQANCPPYIVRYLYTCKRLTVIKDSTGAGDYVEFAPEAIEEIARVAAEVNSTVENIGARRLQTVMEKLLDDLSFTATDRAGETVVIDADLVRTNVSDLAKNADLSKFIL